MGSTHRATFDRNYEAHLQHLKLKGLQPKTIDAYARAVRRAGEYFGHDIAGLSEQQLADYFCDLMESHSWSAVKLDLYGLKLCIGILKRTFLPTPPGASSPPRRRRLPAARGASGFWALVSPRWPRSPSIIASRILTDALFEIIVEGEFSAAHFLKLYDGSFEPKHGHIWKVAVTAQSAELDSMGVVIDFEALKPALKKVLAEFHETLFNDHPYFKAGVNSSTENIAKLIHDRLVQLLPKSAAKITKVTVWETPDAQASFIAR